MVVISRAKHLLAAGASAAALLSPAAAAAQAAAGQPTDAPLATAAGPGRLLEGLVVTAERREESALDAPMALTAFSAEDLRERRIDGGQDLLLASPNVNYARGNFGGYNLSIRGIGSKFVGNSGEYGVSVHENATPISASRIADAEYFDVERVELLRGPQGTLYGRNATGGAVNLITARPGDTLGGYATADLGAFAARRFTAAINLPLNDMLAIRWAGFSLKRDGFGRNLATGHDIDGRNIQAQRLSVRLHPNTAVDVTALWERFDEKDDRSRVGKELCIQDPGPTSVGATAVTGLNRGFLSQGCLPGSRYQAAAFGAANTAATLGGLYLPLLGLAPGGNLAAGKVQDSNLLDIESARAPIYEARENFFQLDARLSMGRSLTLESLTGYNEDRGYSLEDYGRLGPTAPFAASPLFPGGIVDDPQLGPSGFLQTFDYYPAHSREFTQELRLYSDFAGAWNFSLGAFHSDYAARADYYIFSNGLTALAQVGDLGGVPNVYPFFIDPGFPPSDGLGHNYYRNASRSRTRSDAVFGELYWRPAASWKLTAGLRLTRDRKLFQPDPITLFAAATEAAPPPGSGQVPNPAFSGGRGHPPAPGLMRTDSAPTGRLAVEWTPRLGFTDRTMVYASYSLGYKAGGFNTPCDPASPGCAAIPRTFAPEYVDAYEIGTKNVLAHGALAVNVAAFHYDYQGYQISTIVNKASVNQNIDARIDGLEFESVWRPSAALRFDLGVGWLHTAIQGGSVIDTLDRTQGNPALAVVKAQDASNCVVNRAALASFLASQEGLPGAPSIPGVTGNATALLGLCSGLYSAYGLYDYSGLNVVTTPIVVDNQPRPNTVVQVGQGVAVPLRGKRLPNAPNWTLSFGAQYAWELRNWRVTLRGDYYRQGDSYARIFNTVTDHLRGYQVVNATLSFARPGAGVEVQLYVKNLTDEQPITNLYLADDSSGLFTNSFTLDPRIWGVAVTKRF